NEHRIAELVRAVAGGFQHRVGPSERIAVLECTQHLMVALMGFVRAGKDRVDDVKARGGADALGSDTFSGAPSGMFQSANDGRPHRGDSVASHFCITNG